MLSRFRAQGPLTGPLFAAALGLAGCGVHGAAAAHTGAPVTVTSAPTTASSTVATLPPASAQNSTAASASASTSTARPTTAAPTARSTRPVAPAGPCSAAQLTVSLGTRAASASRTSQGIVFRNRAAAACTLQGWPAVDVVAASGMQVGPAAAQAAGTASTVTLVEGGAAVAILSYVSATSSSPAGCEAQPAAGLLVFAPGQTSSTQVPDSFELCTDQADRPAVTVVTVAGS